MNKSSLRKHASARAVFRTYVTHVRRYPFLLFLVFGGTIGIQVADLAIPVYLKKFFDTLADNVPGPTAADQLIGIIAIIALLWLVRWVSNRLEHFSNIYLESRVMADLLSDAFEYLMGHSYSFFISRFTGSLTHRVNKFSRSFETMFDAIVLQFFPTFLFIAGAVVVLYLRNYVLGIALFVWVVAFVLFQVYVTNLRRPLRVARADADTRVTGALADAISNHATAVAFSGGTHEYQLFKSVAGRWREATIASWFADGLIWSGMGIFMMAIEIGLLYGAVIFWKQGLLTIGDFVLIQAYLLTIFERLISIHRDLRRFHDAFADASEMVAMLEEPHGVRDVESALSLNVKSGEIRFRNVRFSFDDPKPVLRDFNLLISPREKVALVGPSGAGKTTITRLLLRFHDVVEGSIEVDGQSVSSVTQESLRDAISFVPQEPLLFHRSLIDNIRYGKRGASDAEVIDAAKKAHCHEFISALPDRYGTFVGERGVKLSGGERQRVAIARAILKDAPILVLDEATSSLDSESEALIQDALDVLMEGKTVVVIAHRLSTIMRMDRIVVLEHGAIIAEGTHEELLAQGGLYERLWSIQAGGFHEERKPDPLEDIVSPISSEEDGEKDTARRTPREK